MTTKKKKSKKKNRVTPLGAFHDFLHGLGKPLIFSLIPRSLNIIND